MNRSVVFTASATGGFAIAGGLVGTVMGYDLDNSELTLGPYALAVGLVMVAAALLGIGLKAQQGETDRALESLRTLAEDLTVKLDGYQQQVDRIVVSHDRQLEKLRSDRPR